MVSFLLQLIVVIDAKDGKTHVRNSAQWRFRHRGTIHALSGRYRILIGTWPEEVEVVPRWYVGRREKMLSMAAM